MDLSIVFDSVNVKHIILLMKWSKIGIKVDSLKLLNHIYLNRKQCLEASHNHKYKNYISVRFLTMYLSVL